MKRIFFFITLTSLLFSCSEKTPEKTVIQEPSILADQAFQELRDHADQRNTAEVLKYFSYERPEIRAQAALVSGSIQDSLLIPSLINALTDSATEVRFYATWALGQMYSELPIEALELRFQIEDDPATRIEVYRALARSYARSEAVNYPAAPLSGPDTEAWLNGVYQLTLFRKEEPYLDQVIPFLNFPSEETRLIASQILARTGNTLSESIYEELESRMMVETDAEVKMAMVLSTRKAPNGLADSSLHELVLDENQHPGVRINAIRSLRAGTMAPPPGMVNFLTHRYEDIAIEISKWIAQYPVAVQQVLERGVGESSARVRAELYAAAISNEAVEFPDLDLIDTILAEKELYSRSAFLKKLPESSESISFSHSMLDTCKNPVLLSSLAESVSAWDVDRDDVEDLWEMVLRSGDAGACAVIATSLSSVKWKGNDMLLDSLLNEMELPRETETFNSLVQALNFQNGSEELEMHTPEYNHPIVWEGPALNKEKVKVEIKTTKGNIELELYPRIAPGTVIDFLRLVESGYYNGKYFHRVVPNFVIQGGCPRGDGWGSMDYSIRSEFSPLDYDAGSLGMASAGKDTESCQWFITHSPTPHLEGRYTLFGKVSKGLEVAWWIKEGDIIESISILE